MTVHRLLGWTPNNGWRFDASRPAEYDEDGNPIAGPLPYSAVILDEASMVDVELFAGLFQSLKPDRRLVIVGDVDQLPSIGPGRVLYDLISSGKIPVVRLTHIFRQAEESRIPYIAREINEGLVPDTAALSLTAGSDVAWASIADVHDLAASIVEVVTELVPARHGVPPDQIQVLCPQHGTPVGDEILNEMLQARLNDRYSTDVRDGIRVGRGYRLFQGDRVIHANRNNYTLMVANGEVGNVVAQAWRGLGPGEVEALSAQVDKELVTSGKGQPCIVVDFGDRLVGYTKHEAGDLELAYAITVHKSQGSQFPCVVVPVHGENRFMLTRPLLYTAVTRAERLLVLLGEEDVLSQAVSNTRGTARQTTLPQWLHQGVGVTKT